MSRAEIHSGLCGYVTQVEATLSGDGRHVDLRITSDCPAVQRLAAELSEVDAFQEITYRGDGPRTLALARKLSHTACPVPAGIVKAVEVAAGLALPAPARIDVSG
jgi:hypothetical protein